jgi:hypothetical protein
MTAKEEIEFWIHVEFHIFRASNETTARDEGMSFNEGFVDVEADAWSVADLDRAVGVQLEGRASNPLPERIRGYIGFEEAGVLAGHQKVNRGNHIEARQR